jgi:lipopolysaccharide export LptBFGC system permease protein LptF
MRLARPSTLWRFLNLELWKLLLLTAAVVVAVTAFGFAIRPLADGRLTPFETLRFMMYAVVPMTQYALPFAAGFAATMVYHRLGSDNEATAVFASGISHRTLLFPAATTGLVLGVAMLLLADQAIPRLLRGMQEMITQDVARMLVAQIKRGDSIRLGPSRMVYADSVTALGPDAKSGAFEQLVLSGVLAVELDASGAVTREASSRAAYVWLYRGQRASATSAGDRPASRPDELTGGTTIVLRLREAIGQGRGMGLSELEDTTLVYAVPSAFSDDPKFFTYGELRRIRENPETLDFIEARRRGLANAMLEQAVARGVGAVLAKEGRLVFKDTAGRSVTLRASGLGAFEDRGDWALKPIASHKPGQGSAIEVLTAGEDGPPRVQRAARGWLSAGSFEGPSAGTVTLRLENVEGQGAPPVGAPESGPVAGQLSKWSMQDLQPPESVLPEIARLGAVPLLARAEEELKTGPGDPRVEHWAQGLAHELRYLDWEIMSKLHERLATAVACVVMVFCGAVLGLRKRDSLPLGVYLWSFLPALACLLTISGGQKTAHSHGPVGLLLLWGGVLALTLNTLVEYRRLAKR